jgi:hypothetical protein
MRYQEIKNQIVQEAPMNPSSFANAIKTGEGKGVQVGFEFEVCIPSESVSRWKNGEQQNGAYDPNSMAWIEGKTVSDMLTGINTFGNLSLNDALDDLFKNKSSVAREIGNTSVWKSYVSWGNKKVEEFQRNQKSQLIPELKKLFKDPVLNEPFGEHTSSRSEEGDTRTLKEVFIEELRDRTGLDFGGTISAEELKQAKPKIIEALSRMYYRTRNPVDRRFLAVAEIDQDAVNQFRSELFSSSRYNTDADQAANITRNFTDFCKEIYGTDNLKELLKSKWAFKGRVNNATPALKEKLWYFVTPGAEVPAVLRPRQYSSSYASYMDGAEFLKDHLKGNFGDNMVIFTGYHQDTKKLDRWYIEPDGSLRPKNNDYSAEVVSPPLKAKDAMYALAKFYENAAGMKLYTNDSTGLHINVSIPETLDVLKLALFVGDQHVLKSYGRENNRYANSILQALKSRADSISGTPSEMQDELKRIASRLSGDHFATVNFNGKYVSFRHAGGDYLNKEEEIRNTVGRFIHAMIIASDPQMYREEYMKKVVAMIEQNKKPKDDLTSEIKTRGIPALVLDFILFKDENGDITSARNDVQTWLNDNIDSEKYLISSAGAKERMLSANGLSTVTREHITQGDDSSFLRAFLYPTDKNQLETINRLIRNNNAMEGRVANPFGVYTGGTRYNGRSSDSKKSAVGVMMPIKMTSKDKGYAQAYRGLIGSSKANRLPLPESD